jgi:hypothetical protein
MPEGRAVRTIETLGGIAALIAVAVYWNFSTLSPCGILRESVRQRDGLAAVLPDSIVDLALAGQYPSELPQSISDAPELHILNVQVSIGKAGALNAKAAVWTGAATVLSALNSIIGLF